jgi:hypothetical protein
MYLLKNIVDLFKQTVLRVMELVFDAVIGSFFFFGKKNIESKKKN